MIVELYVAAPANPSFNYVAFTLTQDSLVEFVSIGCDLVDAFVGGVFIYRSAITAYDVANNVDAIFIDRQVYVNGLTYPSFTAHYSKHLGFTLSAGTYTFAYYNQTVCTNLKLNLVIK